MIELQVLYLVASDLRYEHHDSVGSGMFAAMHCHSSQWSNISTSPKMAMLREVNGTIPMAPDQRLETLMVTDAIKKTALSHFSVRFCNVLDVTLMRMSQCPLDAGVHSVMVKPTSLGFADRASRPVWISVTQIDNTDLDENVRRIRENQLWASRWRGWLWKRSRMQGSFCACNAQIQIALRYRTW